jgi:hypothetical protein
LTVGVAKALPAAACCNSPPTKLRPSDERAVALVLRHEQILPAGRIDQRLVQMPALE